MPPKKCLKKKNFKFSSVDIRDTEKHDDINMRFWFANHNYSNIVRSRKKNVLIGWYNYNNLL